MPIRLDTMGNIVYRLQKPFETKNVIERLKFEVSPNKHWVHVGVDGKFVEIEGINSIDEKRREAGATFRDDNTELGRSSMIELSKERYDKPKFLEKHGALLINVGAITIIMVFLWLIADKLIDLVGSIAGVVQQMGQIQEAQDNILTSLNNLLRTTNLG